VSVDQLIKNAAVIKHAGEDRELQQVLAMKLKEDPASLSKITEGASESILNEHPLFKLGQK
jgi:hypothetical protein